VVTGFSDKTMRHETPSLYIRALAASIARQSALPNGGEVLQWQPANIISHIRIAPCIGAPNRQIAAIKRDGALR
jgi:hypothetical protein